VRRLIAAAAAAAMLVGPTAAQAAGTNAPTPSVPATIAQPNTPFAVPDTNFPYPGRSLSAHQVIDIAARLPKVRAARASYPGSYAGAYVRGPGRWQVSYFSPKGRKEIAQVLISDANGRVLEQWTGFQVAWTMARGYPGAFGHRVNALYIWIPLSVLFVLPFVRWRRPLSLLHLDLLALSFFSVSLAFFNHGRIYGSVPLAYPPLLYLLGRMLAVAAVGRRRPSRAPAPPLRTWIPVPWLAVMVVFLVGFRIGLNLVDGNVIDVGYAGVIGASRVVHGQPLYGHWPADNQRGDTYGPVNYEAYVPFEQTLGWSGRWDKLPAAHGAAIAFDLLALVLIFLLGRRVRGPTLGIVLAYAWVSYPFTLYALECDSNDTLVAVLVLAALLLATGPKRRGALAALAGLTKFAPLALAPVLATHGLHDASRRRRVVGLAAFTIAFLLVGAVAAIPAFTHSSLHTFVARTIDYQANRDSPFSVWGLYGGLGVPQAAVQVGAVLLAIALAVVPRRPDLIGLAAAVTAILVAVQLGIDHWFYLYIPWFFAPAMLALLGRFSEPAAEPGAASEPARSHQLVAA
jgi:hypothetical protein